VYFSLHPAIYPPAIIGTEIADISTLLGPLMLETLTLDCSMIVYPFIWPYAYINDTSCMLSPLVVPDIYINDTSCMLSPLVVPDIVVLDTSQLVYPG
jgi:hypothetical protein